MLDHECCMSDVFKKTNTDWITALKMRFSVRLTDKSSPKPAIPGRPLEDVNQYPVLHKSGSSLEFSVCCSRSILPPPGALQQKVRLRQRVQQRPLARCIFRWPTVIFSPSRVESCFRQEKDGTFLSQVGEKASIDVQFTVRNTGERAYEALLTVEFDSNELEVPELRKERGSINIGQYKDNSVSVLLGNPLEQDAVVSPQKHGSSLFFR
jgi:hypothetical protein